MVKEENVFKVGEVAVQTQRVIVFNDESMDLYEAIALLLNKVDKIEKGLS